MTSYEFEKKAKEQLISAILQEYDEIYTIDQIHMILFSSIMGNMKGIFFDCGYNNRCYEVTYLRKEDEMCIEPYEKQKSIVVEHVSGEG